MNEKILLVEGKRAEASSFAAGLGKKGYQVQVAANGRDALALLKTETPDLLVVNAASLRASGRRICMSIRQQERELPLILIVNPETAEAVGNDLANVVLTLPFTLQKLVNRMRILLPGKSKGTIKVGRLELDPLSRRATLDGRQTKLTPRLSALLECLMRKPNEVIPREKLFCEVWKTAYTGDTRSLDVHISWLRQAIEPDPEQSQVILTVRGMGYRLDVDYLK